MGSSSSKQFVLDDGSTLTKGGFTAEYSIVLVPAGSDDACIFHTNYKTANRSTPCLFTFARDPDHPLAIVLNAPPKLSSDNAWLYSPLGAHPAASGTIVPLSIRFDGDYICVDQLLFDVCFWTYTEGMPILLLRGNNCCAKTRIAGHGRDFVQNAGGTISPMKAPNLVFGCKRFVRNRLVLIKAEDSEALRFEQLNTYSQQPLRARSPLYPGGCSVVFANPENPVREITITDGASSTFAQYIELAIAECGGENTQTPIAVQLRGKLLTYEHPGIGLFALDVTFWKYFAGNTVNMVRINRSTCETKGCCCIGTACWTHGRKFIINKNSTISPAQAKRLVLGVGYEYTQ